MIIIYWFIGVLFISMVLGEIHFHRLSTVKKNNFNQKSVINKEMNNLNIENIGFASNASLAMRGSWRLAKNSFINSDDLYTMINKEFSKKII